MTLQFGCIISTREGEIPKIVYTCIYIGRGIIYLFGIGRAAGFLAARAAVGESESAVDAGVR